MHKDILPTLPRRISLLRRRIRLLPPGLAASAELHAGDGPASPHCLRQVPHRRAPRLLRPGSRPSSSMTASSARSRLPVATLLPRQALSSPYARGRQRRLAGPAAHSGCGLLRAALRMRASGLGQSVGARVGASTVGSNAVNPCAKALRPRIPPRLRMV